MKNLTVMQGMRCKASHGKTGLFTQHVLLGKDLTKTQLMLRNQMLCVDSHERTQVVCDAAHMRRSKIATCGFFCGVIIGRMGIVTLALVECFLHGQIYLKCLTRNESRVKENRPRPQPLVLMCPAL